MVESTVTISLDKYEMLLERSFKLECLERQGVDNWSGYDDAMQEFYGDESC